MRQSTVLRLLPFVIVLILTALAASALIRDEAPIEIPPYVTSGDNVYLLLSPLPVVGDRVRSVSWSSTGNFLVSERREVDSASQLRDAVRGTHTDKPTRLSLTLYDVAKRAAQVAWTGEAGQSEVGQVQWLHGTDILLFVVHARQRTVDPTKPEPSTESLYLWDAASGALKLVIRVPQEGGLPELLVDSSPLGNWALVTITARSAALPTAAPGSSAPVAAGAPGWTSRYYVLGSTGDLQGPLQVDSDVLPGGWRAPDGLPIFYRVVRTQARPRIEQFVLDLKTRKLEQASSVAKWEPPAVQQPILAVLGDQKSPTTDGHEAKLVSALDDSAASIAADASIVELSPSLSAVAYVTDGVAIVRPILRMPRKAFLQAVVEAERQRAISYAKQVGVAAQIYATDYDDSLPGSGFDMQDILNPYLKNEAALKNFVYSFRGGDMADIKDPATTELGYVTGPGGRAMIYLDGHVVWISDK